MGIYRPAIPEHFEMQVRAAGQPSGADEADHIALADAIACAQARREAREVPVKRRIAILMTQDNDLAIPTFHSDILNHAVAGGLDPGAGRSAVIDALVRAPFLQDGMEARRSEAGRNT